MRARNAQLVFKQCRAVNDNTRPIQRKTERVQRVVFLLKIGRAAQCAADTGNIEAAIANGDALRFKVGIQSERELLNRHYGLRQQNRARLNKQVKSPRRRRQRGIEINVKVARNGQLQSLKRREEATEQADIARVHAFKGHIQRTLITRDKTGKRINPRILALAAIGNFRRAAQFAPLAQKQDFRRLKGLAGQFVFAENNIAHGKRLEMGERFIARAIACPAAK